MARRYSREVRIGGLAIGGAHPIAVQSMTITDTRDVAATLVQIAALAGAGCEIVRCAVPDLDAAKAFREIVAGSAIPVVADIHFDYRLAIAAAENGAHKLRVNPGNLGGADRLKAVADCAKAHGIPLRVGVNAGSLAAARTAEDVAGEMVQSALSYISDLEGFGFYDTVLALKASDLRVTVAANRLLAGLCQYPLHIGVTEAGMRGIGTIKSAVGIGALLLDGIGDTLRVSLTGDPLPEVKAGIEILSALGLRKNAVEIISCPTCGRTQVDLEAAVEYVRARVPCGRKSIKLAVMGCAVNGPGEARDADLGVACGKGNAVLFGNGLIMAHGELYAMLDLMIEKAIGLLEEL
ncbi:MAG: flavodoxin-dependent (E)-4-hydroxy-3-methylbut-2-enyl-diphosphate synthase [Clostridiales bacterium]|nr:flavodoxin-dependent (E)-4-hydroxy-3-methylbut-2-enyl-diphosphate synthase [Clostridiales bacterium]